MEERWVSKLYFHPCNSFLGCRSYKKEGQSDVLSILFKRSGLNMKSTVKNLFIIKIYLSVYLTVI